MGQPFRISLLRRRIGFGFGRVRGEEDEGEKLCGGRVLGIIVGGEGEIRRQTDRQDRRDRQDRKETDRKQAGRQASEQTGRKIMLDRKMFSILTRN